MADDLRSRLLEPRYISDEDHARTPDAVLTTLQEFRRERYEAVAALDERDERIKALEAGLEHIAEYWNRDQNETAMADALWHIIETAEALTNPTPAKPRQGTAEQPWCDPMPETPMPDGPA
jgi:hypothetical protein